MENLLLVFEVFVFGSLFKFHITFSIKSLGELLVGIFGK